MLDLFRSKGLTNLIYGIVIIATILVFVIQFRPGANQKTAPLAEQCAVRVYGSCLTPRDQIAAYYLLMPRGPQGEPLTQQAKRMKLKDVALNGLIERELLIHEASRLGLSVSDDELTNDLFNGFVRYSPPSDNAALAEQLHSYKLVDFRDPKTHEVNDKTYRRKVKDLTGRSEKEFHKEQERELLASKMRDLIRAPVRVSEDEAWDEFVREKSIASVRYVEIPFKFLKRYAVSATDADVAAWAKDHQVDIDKETESRKRSDLPKDGHVRHVLAKFPAQNPTADEKASTLAKISLAWARLKAGEPIPEVARDLSDDMGAVLGGDAGEKHDAFGAAFQKAADALKPGEMTQGAVETSTGYEIIARDDPAKSADVEAAIKKNVPRDLYLMDKAKTAARDLATRIISSMTAGTDADLAIKNAIQPFVKPAAPVTPVKVIADTTASTAADAGATADASAPAKTTDKPVPPKPYTADTDPDRPQVKTSTAFNRGGDPIPDLEDEPQEQQKVLAFAFLVKEGETMQDPIQTATQMIIVQVKEQKTATRDDFEKNKETELAMLLRAKQAEALSLYVKQLRDSARSDIKIENPLTDATKDGGAPAEPDEEEY